MMSIRLGEDFDHDHHAAATGARRPGLRAHIVICGFLDWPRRVSFVLNLKQLATQCQIGPTPRIGKQAVMANTMATRGENMKQEAADELVGLQCHGFLPLAMAIVPPFEGDGVIITGYQATVRDGNAPFVVCDANHCRAVDGYSGRDRRVLVSARQRGAWRKPPN
jgi:hypothetical protein